MKHAKRPYYILNTLYMYGKTTLGISGNPINITWFEFPHIIGKLLAVRCIE